MTVEMDKYTARVKAQEDAHGDDVKATQIKEKVK